MTKTTKTESVNSEIKKKQLNTILECSIWFNLDSITNYELIILKGHLIIETILITVLQNNNIDNTENYSFYRKIGYIEKLDFTRNELKRKIVLILLDLNNLRNKLAHEFTWDVNNGELEQWSLKVLNSLDGQKFTKYTFRTKIVHAFSVLARNLLDLK